MRPERAAELAARWVRLYTRGLPAPIAQRRVGEIDADLHDQIAQGRADGTADRRIALSILSRIFRGLPADAAWRGQQADARGRRAAALRPLVGIVRVVALLLLVPLVAMLFTDEVVWGPADFVVAGLLLGGAGLVYRLVAAIGGSVAYRAAAGVAVATALLLVWVDLAVGIIGDEGDWANLMYGGVLAVGAVGAIAARLRPRGMARALLAMALAQMLIAVIALIAGKHQDPVSSLFEILALNGIFAALFSGSALLFLLAERKRRRHGSAPVAGCRDEASATN